MQTLRIVIALSYLRALHALRETCPDKSLSSEYVQAIFFFGQNRDGNSKLEFSTQTLQLLSSYLDWHQKIDCVSSDEIK